MFGLDFLFLGGLLALPVAALPVILHLLHRKKSPVVLFSTTRFVRASLQRTAARRRVQKWLLLAARVLLLLLLILVAAQPARRLAAGLTNGQSTAAAIVVDTSYSTLLTQDQQTALQRADGIVTELLQNDLNGANVAVYTSLAGSTDGTFTPAATLLTRWTPLQAEPSPRPLIDRIEAARQALEAQPAGAKWLIVLSDLQAREFPRSLQPGSAGEQGVLFDLHPPAPRSAGVAELSLQPEQPLPGVTTEARIRLTGRPGDARGVSVEVLGPDGSVLQASAPRVARFSPAGEAQLSIPIKLPARPFALLRARLDGEDDLAWDNTRRRALQMPRQQQVRLITRSTTPTPGERMVKLALDPSEGRSADWPLRVTSGPQTEAESSAIVTELGDWSDRSLADDLRRAADRGVTIVLLLRPGLQESWSKLPADQQQRWRPLLPGTPRPDATADRPHRAVPPASGQSFLSELLDERFQLSAMTAQRLVPFDARPDATLLLAAAPVRSGPPLGLLYRHPLGAGTVYTLTTLPDPAFSSLATHPVFLPMLVRCCLTAAIGQGAQNVEIGQPLSMVSPADHRTVTTPAGASTVVRRQPGTARLVYDDTREPGLYTWTDSGGALVGVAEVRYPAEEATLRYREPGTAMAGENVIVATDLAGFRAALARVTQPAPKWSPLIAGVLLLLCFEALVGNSARLWRLWSKPAPRDNVSAQ